MPITEDICIADSIRELSKKAGRLVSICQKNEEELIKNHLPAGAIIQLVEPRGDGFRFKVTYDLPE